MSRSQAEIVARFTDIEGDDVFGFRREVLLSALDFEHAKPHLKDGVTEEEWTEARTVDFNGKAREYLDFAIEKIRDHRGISASRSVDKLGEFAWLLQRDDVVTAMDEAGYAQYGAPKVKAFAAGMGFDWPTDDELLDRMAEGFECTYGCQEGCGQ